MLYAYQAGQLMQIGEFVSQFRQATVENESAPHSAITESVTPLAFVLNSLLSNDNIL